MLPLLVKHILAIKQDRFEELSIYYKYFELYVVVSNSTMTYFIINILQHVFLHMSRQIRNSLCLLLLNNTWRGQKRRTWGFELMRTCFDKYRILRI